MTVQEVRERKKTVNVNQAASIIGCSRSHVYRLLELGALEGYRIGHSRGVRIYTHSVESFIEKKEFLGI